MKTGPLASQLPSGKFLPEHMTRGEAAMHSVELQGNSGTQRIRPVLFPMESQCGLRQPLAIQKHDVLIFQPQNTLSLPHLELPVDALAGHPQHH